MADNAVIGALRVVLGLDSATFEEGLKTAGNKLSGFEKTFASVSTGVVAAGTLIASGIANVASSIASSMQDAINKIANIGLTAQKIGSNVQDFALLAGAAGKVKISTDDLGQSLIRLSRNIAEVASGKQTEATKAFEVMGITLRDKVTGEVKTSTQVFAELSDKFKDYVDGANEVALANAVGGRGFAAMIPLLNQGSEATRKQAEEMAALGIVMDKQTVDAALKVQKEIDKLGKIFDNLILKFTIGLLPTIQQLTGELVGLTKNWQRLQDVQDGFAASIQFIMPVINTLVTLVKVAGIEIISFFEAIGLARKGEFSAALGVLKEAQVRVFELGKEFIGIKPPIEESAKELLNWSEIMKAVDDSMAALGQVKIAAPAIPLGNLTKTLADLTVKTAELRGEFNNLAPGFAEQARQLGLVDQFAIKLTNDQTTLTAAQQALNQAMLQNTAAQMVQSNLEPWQQYEQTLQRVNLLLQNHALTADQAAVISRKAAESTGQAWDIAAGKIAGDLASGLAAAAQANKQFSAAAKIAAIAQAIFNTYTAATKALATYPPPFGYAAAGAAVIAGLGYVAKIQSQQFAKGGSFKVAGGLSGVDSQMISFAAAPGEMVDVRKPGQASGPGGGASGVQEISLTGIRPSDLFSGEMLRGLFDSLNSGMRDGYKLTVPA